MLGQIGPLGDDTCVKATRVAGYPCGCEVAAMIWSRTDWSGSGGGSIDGSCRIRSKARSM